MLRKTLGKYNFSLDKSKIFKNCLTHFAEATTLTAFLIINFQDMLTAYPIMKQSRLCIKSFWSFSKISLCLYLFEKQRDTEIEPFAGSLFKCQHTCGWARLKLEALNSIQALQEGGRGHANSCLLPRMHMIKSLDLEAETRLELRNSDMACWHPSKPLHHWARCPLETF